MTTQTGMEPPFEWPVATRASTMMPMVFWASCSPWPSAIEAADRVWAIQMRPARRPDLHRDLLVGPAPVLDRHLQLDLVRLPAGQMRFEGGQGRQGPAPVALLESGAE